MRSARRDGARTSSRGLSLRRVEAPTRDRVAVRTHGVDPVEVGHHSTAPDVRRSRCVDVAVDRHAAAEQCVRAFRHVRRPRVSPPAPQSARNAPSRRRPRPATIMTAPGRVAAEREHAVHHRNGDAPAQRSARPRRTPTRPHPRAGPSRRCAPVRPRPAARPVPVGAADPPAAPSRSPAPRRRTPRRGPSRRGWRRARCPARPASRGQSRGGRW